MDIQKKVALRPVICVFSGTPLSGKTYLAKRIAEIFDILPIDVDEIRHELDETRRQGGEIKLLEPAQEREIMIRSYTELCCRGKELAVSGKSVLITGTFSREEFKQPLSQLVSDLAGTKIPLKIFLLTVSDAEVEKRIASRRAEGSFSNIDTLEKFNWAKQFFSPVAFFPVVKVDSSNPEQIAKIRDALMEFAI